MSNLLDRAAKDPVFFGYAFLDWHAHPKQAQWLRESCKQQNWNRAGNRWGKTESIAIKHLWRCTFKDRLPMYPFDDPYTTINCALSLDQATLPLTKAWRLLHKQPAENFRKAFIRRFVVTPFPKIEFLNGSVWWARSTVRKGVYLEGHDFDFASVDEAAFAPDLGHILDQVLQLRLLDRGGQLDCISTGKRGSEFNRRFEQAKTDPTQYAFQGKTADNPAINKAALQRVMNILDPGLIQERLMGGERPSDGLIPYESIMRAQAKWTIDDWAGNETTANSPPKSGHRYSSGWDLAKENDFVVGWTFDVTDRPFQLVAWEKFNKHTLPSEWTRGRGDGCLRGRGDEGTRGRVFEGTGGRVDGWTSGRVDEEEPQTPKHPNTQTLKHPNTQTPSSDHHYWDYVVGRIRDRHRMYGGLTTIDATGLGVVVADHLTDIGADAFVFTGQRLAELIGCLTLAYGLGVVAHPHLQHTLPNGRLWTFVDELEEVSDRLNGLDTATAEALALWGVREQLRGDFPIQLGAKVAGLK